MNFNLDELADITKSFVLRNSNQPFDFIDLTQCPYPVKNFTEHLSVNPNCFIITGDYTYYKNKHPKIKYFPSYFFQILNNPCLKQYDFLSPRPYFLQCLNINPWLHKTLTVLKLSQAKWFDQCLVSFHWSNPPDRLLENYNLIDSTLGSLNDNEKVLLKSLDLPLTLNLENEPDPIWWTHVSNASNAHRLSYLDCVTETSGECNFISEKIWKPFLSGQFFVVVGSPGIVKHLEDIGLDVYQDIIDYTQYDSITDIRKKINVIYELLDDFYHQDIEKLWIETYTRRKYNFDFMYSRELEVLLSKDLKQLFR